MENLDKKIFRLNGTILSKERAVALIETGRFRVSFETDLFVEIYRMPKFYDEILDVIVKILWVILVVILVGAWVASQDAFPTSSFCCVDGEWSSGPSGMIMILSIILFPLFILIGLFVIYSGLGFVGIVMLTLIIMSPFIAHFLVETSRLR